MIKSLIKAPVRKWRARGLQRRICGEVARAAVCDQTGFPGGVCLPPKYGCGLPERVVELLFARLTYRPALRVLDVGYANAMDCHLDMVRGLPQPRNITGIDIAPPNRRVAPLYQASIQGDIAASGLESASFDLIWCISVLEHIGMDNTGYTAQFRRGEGLDFLAVAEMVRLLAHDGVLLISVPFGRYEEHGWLRNYDPDHWQVLLSAADTKATISQHHYRHTYAEGWREVPPEELQYVGYYDQANAGSGGLAVAHIRKAGSP